MHNQREHRTPPAQTHALRQCDLPCFPPRHRQPPPAGQPGPSRARLPSACRPSGRQPRATGTHREVLALLGRPDQTAWTGLVTQLHPSQIERDLAEETCPQLVPRAPLGSLPPPCPAPAARLPSSHTTPSRRRLRTRSLSRRCGLTGWRTPNIACVPLRRRRARRPGAPAHSVPGHGRGGSYACSPNTPPPPGSRSPGQTQTVSSSAPICLPTLCSPSSASLGQAGRPARPASPPLTPTWTRRCERRRPRPSRTTFSSFSKDAPNTERSPRERAAERTRFLPTLQHVEEKALLVLTDGSCFGKPGPSGAGVAASSGRLSSRHAGGDLQQRVTWPA